MVGDGRRTKFWKDSWCGNTPQNAAYPTLFTIACAKNSWVEGLWSAEMGGGCWNPSFVRPFNDWKMDDVESLLCRIGGRRVIEGVDPKMVCFLLNLCTKLWSKKRPLLFHLEDLCLAKN